MIEDLQRQIDACAYPPTHTYTLTPTGPIPTGQLAERMEIFETVAPGFFNSAGGLSFLDIGASKGFFSLQAARHGANVVAIEPDTDCIGLIRQAATEIGLTITRVNSRFQNYVCDQMFDRVFIGNANHYLFREAEGFDWIRKLAAVCKPGARVLLEGPLGLECEDVRRALPASIAGDFTRLNFHAVRQPFFVQERCVPAISYTPDRYVLLLKRRPDGWSDRVDLADLTITGDLSINERNESSVHTALWHAKSTDSWPVILKIYANTTRDLEWSVNLSRLSPYSNGLIARVFDQDRWVGWLEKPIEGSPFGRFEYEAVVWQAHCMYNATLAAIGYIDKDFGTPNWYPTREQLRNFDKNSVHPISSLTERDWDVEHGTIFRTLRFSHRRVPEAEKLSKALATKDAGTIMHTFKELAQHGRC